MRSHPLLLAATRGANRRKGESLFRQRQRPRQMYLVASGDVALERIGAKDRAVVLQRIRQDFVAAEASLQSGIYLPASGNSVELGAIMGS